MDRERSVHWEHAKEHATDALIFILFFFGLAIIFAELWVPIIPYIQDGMKWVGDPVLFMLSLTMFLSILWNISFYLIRKKELQVARKLIRWVASQRSVVPRTDKEKERVDRVLKTAIWALRNGENLQDVINELYKGTHKGENLPNGWARSHYETVIERLTNAAGRDQVFSWEERERDLQEGEKMLWATRVENQRARIE